MSDAKKQDIYEEIKGKEARRIRYKILAVIGITVLLVAGFAYAVSNINIIPVHGTITASYPGTNTQTVVNPINSTNTFTRQTEVTVFSYSTNTTTTVVVNSVVSTINTTITAAVNITTVVICTTGPYPAC